MISMMQLFLLLALVGSSDSASSSNELDDPHEWLSQRPCSFSQWPQGDEVAARSYLTPAQFQENGMAERPLLVRTRVDSEELAANWSTALDEVAGEARVRSLRAAHRRTEGGLYRYLKKFETESSLGDFLGRSVATRAARQGPTAANPDQEASSGEYVFMQTDFVSDGLGGLLPMMASPTFLLESIEQQDMCALRDTLTFCSMLSRNSLSNNETTLSPHTCTVKYVCHPSCEC